MVLTRSSSNRARVKFTWAYSIMMEISSVIFSFLESTGGVARRVSVLESHSDRTGGEGVLHGCCAGHASVRVRRIGLVQDFGCDDFKQCRRYKSSREAWICTGRTGA